MLVKKKRGSLRVEPWDFQILRIRVDKDELAKRAKKEGSIGW